MKKFMLGLICGAALTATTTIYAADDIKALLFPVKFQFNGESKEYGSRFAVLNYDGHTYVPVRFMADNLGAGAAFDKDTNTITVVSEPKTGSDAERKVWAVMYRLERGMEGKDVRKVLGDPTSLTYLDSSRQQVWRYDLGAKAGYQSGGLTADTTGLDKGDLDAQLFIKWSPGGLVDRYDLWYVKKGADGSRSIYTYIVYPDGSTAGAKYE
ncbi:stalk domain-containing protein [Paenibacillus cremeus]|uniref:Copper amine oxidase N-terminal domain-containing protein n=1 Tax=Paenibacillus cremeus TaxID=2163881 RepID=A0A559K8J5_9BACL|nr:stalk domain-containing protein [Paenibacillus cremeus]TVY08456.1 copper amine oxidase N-terminal domain-containing protein [Paenibacillus cremeus]